MSAPFRSVSLAAFAPPLAQVSKANPLTTSPAPTFLAITFHSDRSRALLRFVHQLNIKLSLPASPGIFNWIRFQIRFSDLICPPDPQQDESALTADSEADRTLIRCIEECMNSAGYVTLRALAAIREYGSDTAKSMGLHAILQADSLLQDLQSLANLIFLETRINMHRHFSDKSVIKAEYDAQTAIIQRFSQLQSVPRGDINLHASSKGSRILQLPMPRSEDQPKVLQMLESEKRVLSVPWPAMLHCARLLKQSVHMKDEDLHSDSIYIRGRIEKLLDGTVAHPKQLNMDDCLMGGTTLYTAYNCIMQELNRSLSEYMPEPSEEFEPVNFLFEICQKNLVRRFKLLEAINLQHCLDYITSKRNDTRSGTVGRIEQHLRSSLDYLVADLYQNELSITL